MKRMAFTIIVYVLFAIFCVLYSISPVRELLLNLNVGWLTSVYQNLDAFFSFCWERSFGTFVRLDTGSYPLSGITGPVMVFIALTLLVLLIDIGGGAISHHHSSHVALVNKALKEEENKINDTESMPSTFTDFDSNRGIFANTSSPYVSLDRALEPERVETSSVDLNRKKSRPAIRIVLTIILGLVTLFYLFLKFTWETKWQPVYGVFKGFFEIPFVSSVLNNITEFFWSLLPGIYETPLAYVGSVSFSWGQLVELFLSLIFVALVWLLILLICHLIMKKYRKDKISHEQVDVSFESGISDKAKSILGNADLSSPSADVSLIADLSPFPASIERERQFNQRAAYIDDIGESVSDAGTIKNLNPVISPSPIRQPLNPEDLGEDLTKNSAVTITDIASIEDTIKQEEKTVPIETFIVPEEGVAKVDLSTVDIAQIALLSPFTGIDSAAEEEKDDLISFDEDGYAFLVKEGKPFQDEMEDISDVITDQNLDKTAAISRFGKHYYDILDHLEPFSLKPLDYDEEINNIKTRQRQDDLLNAEELLKKSLAEEPFRYLKDDKPLPVVNKPGEVSETKKAPSTSAPQNPKPENVKEEKKEAIPVTNEPKKVEKAGAKPAPLPIPSKAAPLDSKASEKETISQEKPSGPVKPLIVSSSAFGLSSLTLLNQERPLEKPSTPVKAPDDTMKDEKGLLRLKKPLKPVKPLIVPTSAPASAKVRSESEAPERSDLKTFSKPRGKVKPAEPIEAKIVPSSLVSSLLPDLKEPSEDKLPKAEIDQSEPSPALEKKNEKKKTKPVRPLDLNNLTPLTVLSKKPTKGPIEPKIISIEDFLGQKKDK
ncbi:MAG: hypothetical protein LKJ88_06835 [Bacilli bacterium]|jgi:hypothetical protein|nr:hypothetical protein [Bacilli bacterium]